MSKDTLTPHKQDYSLARYNSCKFGLRSEATLLPWENREEYEALHQALLAHHNPVGPTEEHLVSEVASIIWRKQRVLLAEGALYRKELAEDVDGSTHGLVKAALIGKAPSYLQTGDVSLAVTVGPDEERQSLAAAQQALERVRRLRNKVAKEPDYATAFGMLPAELKEGYEGRIGSEMEGHIPEGGDPDMVYDYGTEAADIVFYLDSEVIPALEAQTVQHRYVEDIANQLKGQAFNPEKLELIGRYETHLDRKLERMLAMLIKMQELRIGKP